MKYIDRCFTGTVHFGHEWFPVWMNQLSGFYDEGKIDYAMIALETSEIGRIHLQTFVVFNEVCWVKEEGNKTKTFKPTKLLSGDWSKARSLSGSRDYCARRGIHIEKKGLLKSFELGDWVDPAYNSSLRTRLSYEFGVRLAAGECVTSIALENPMGVLVVGQRQLEDLSTLRGSRIPEGAKMMKRPYYYIGRSELQDFLNSEEIDGWAQAQILYEEE